MKIRPLHDRILVKRIEEEEKTSGGIIIPDTAKEKPQEGRVVAVGNGKVAEDGSILNSTSSMQKNTSENETMLTMVMIAVALVTTIRQSLSYF